MSQKDKDIEYLSGYFRDNYVQMLRTATNILRNPSLAEEIVQETFVTALIRITTMKNSPNPKGWLYAVLRNKCKHGLRDTQYLLSRSVSVDSLKSELPDKNFNDLSLHFSLYDDPDYILVSRLYIYGESIKEIAASDGIEVGACKMRIARAKKRLREKYGDE